MSLLKSFISSKSEYNSHIKLANIIQVHHTVSVGSRLRGQTNYSDIYQGWSLSRIFPTATDKSPTVNVRFGITTRLIAKKLSP